MDQKILKCDDLTYLEDLPVFKEKVNFRIHDKDYVVRESYQEIELDKNEDGLFIKISEDKCYDDKITTYITKLDPNNNSVISYKADGPAIFAYTKPIARSTRTILNRESKSIGYKASTGEKKNTTRVNRHLVFNKTDDYLLEMSKEFYKGNEDDEDNIPLNNTSYVSFDTTDLEVEMSGLLKGTEVIYGYDKDGNIEEHTISYNTYGTTVSGELITLDVNYNYTSSDDYKRNIIPQYDLTDGIYTVRYIQKEKPFITLSTEKFIMNEDKELVIQSIDSKFGHLEFTYIPEDNSFNYTATLEVDENEKYVLKGNCKFPLSGDFFSVDNYKDNVTLAKVAFFNNIYETDNGLDCFLNENKLHEATIDKKGDHIKYTFLLNDYDVIKSANIRHNHGMDETCTYKESKLPNGNRIIESCIPAEFKFPIDKKSLFYRALEIGTDNGNDYIASDYRALVVLQKD